MFLAFVDLVRGVELAKWIRLAYLHVVVNKFDVHGVEGASVPVDFWHILLAAV